MTGDRVLVRVEPESSQFTHESDQWLREREELRGDLERSLGPGVVQQSAPEPGDKGLALIPIIAALGGAHAFQALARCFETWLKYRPGERTLLVTGVVNGEEFELKLNASNVSDDTVKEFLKALGGARK
jgi:hypothetical protein